MSSFLSSNSSNVWLSYKFWCQQMLENTHETKRFALHEVSFDIKDNITHYWQAIFLGLSSCIFKTLLRSPSWMHYDSPTSTHCDFPVHISRADLVQRMGKQLRSNRLPHIKHILLLKIFHPNAIENFQVQSCKKSTIKVSCLLWVVKQRPVGFERR